MAEATAVTAEPRSVSGTRACQKLRAAGAVPGVVYGHKEENVDIQLPVDQVDKMLREGHKVIDLTVSGKTESCLVRDMQWDTFATQVLHIDLMRVSKGELIHTEVEVELHGDAPGVLNGGILEQPHHTLEIEVPALQTPDKIRVDISTMKIGDSITVGNLTLPDNVKCLQPADTPVAVIVADKRVEAEEAAEAAAAEEAAGEE